MAKLTDFYKIVQPKLGTTTMSDNQFMGDSGTYMNSTWYQRLVQGSASRLSRLLQYDMMDNDVEIARSLDTIAEEMCGSDPDSDQPFELVIDSSKDSNIPSSVAQTLRMALSYWVDLHEWDTRIFKVCRVAIKYGDCFFVRKNETQKWEYVHPKNIVAAIVDDHDMTHVVGWQIKRDTKVPNSPYNASHGHYAGTSSEAVDILTADQVIWFTLNDDIGESAPFGESVLRAIYRAQKQKELLEDAIIIYRIQRAPERRVFYIDTGKMPPQRIKSYLEGIKNEIRQRKVPTFGGGTDQLDSTYNPQSMSEDFFFSVRDGGVGSKVEVLPGGAGLGELADLEYFQWKVFRGLRIPLSFMKEGNEGSVMSDGKAGVAYIQELRFAMYVQRLQTYVNRTMDKEFKRYLRAAGIAVDPSIFHIKLNSPENFGVWRQLQLNSELLGVYSQSESIQHMSKRFAQSKFLNMSDEEIMRNFRLRVEEMGLNPDGDPRANMLAVYGPQQEPGMGGDMGLGGGMSAGTLGGAGFDMPLGGGDMDLGGGDMDMGGGDMDLGGGEPPPA